METTINSALLQLARLVQEMKTGQIDVTLTLTALQSNLVQAFSLHDSFNDSVGFFSLVVRGDLYATFWTLDFSLSLDLRQINGEETESLQGLPLYFLLSVVNIMFCEKMFQFGIALLHQWISTIDVG
jgi:hypothetical protein